ncbi:MAG: hypothetical protein AB7S54_00725 [Bacteroidales bacterium]
MEIMLEKNHNMAKFAFHALYEIAKKMTEFIISIKFQTAQERYKTLLQDYPFIFQRVQLSYIASYLGITPETLSRLRAEKNYLSFLDLYQESFSFSSPNLHH